MIGSETNFYLNLHFLEYFDDEVSICPLSLPSNSKIVDTDRLHCSTFLTFLLWKLCLCSRSDAELVNLIWRWNKDDTINLVSGNSYLAIISNFNQCKWKNIQVIAIISRRWRTTQLRYPLQKNKRFSPIWSHFAE